MKIRLFVLAAVAAVSIPAVPSLAAAGRVPVYSSTTYCAKIGSYSGGSYQIEASCRDMEQEAKASIARRNISDRIWIYCDKLGRTAGGSFQIFNSCVDMELEAARRM